MSDVEPMFSTKILAPCWTANDGRCMHYFSGGPTCHCGERKAQSPGHCVRTHLSLVDDHDDTKLDL